MLFQIGLALVSFQSDNALLILEFDMVKLCLMVFLLFLCFDSSFLNKFSTTLSQLFFFLNLDLKLLFCHVGVIRWFSLLSNECSVLNEGLFCKVVLNLDL